MNVVGPQGRITSIAPMPGSLRNAVLGAVAATVIAGCGSDDGTIPEQTADDLLTRLEAIDEHVDQRQCDEARAQAETFSTDVEELPAEVDGEVKQGLEESADQLVNLTTSDCEPLPTGATGAEGVTTEPTEPTTTETTTTEETTTEETTSEEEPTEEQETPEPQQDPDLPPQSSGNPGQGSGGVGSDGGIGPGGSGGDDG